jgi:hypothetical protein
MGFGEIDFCSLDHSPRHNEFKNHLILKPSFHHSMFAAKRPIID